ncbi:MAG: helix-turn-helix domain-containing protein [Rhodospirillaceae bacterium]|nr:helix-turn-helix domain-containing protein [Rhodospirillaceae bacterium]
MEQAVRTIQQLGAVVRRERKKKNLTQLGLGEKVHMRQATVSKLEAGEPATQLRVLFDVLSALGLEIAIRPRSRAAAKIEEITF